MATRLMNREQIREVDRRAIEDFGMPGVVLMENAGRGTAEWLMQQEIKGPVVICAGRGNNGGDGFVVARHLDNHGIAVRVLLFAESDALKGDAAVNYRIIERAGTIPIGILGSQPTRDRLTKDLADADWIVDGLLGTGTQGTIQEPYATIIGGINAAEARVLAIDLPSGLDCDTGQPLGRCIRADLTATFVAPKVGFQAAEAQEWIGTVRVIDIGVPRVIREG